MRQALERERGTSLQMAFQGGEQSEFGIQQEELKSKLEEMKRAKIDCFKMCFRIKVVDAVGFALEPKEEVKGETGKDFPRQIVVSFIMTNIALYESI